MGDKKDHVRITYWLFISNVSTSIGHHQTIGTLKNNNHKTIIKQFRDNYRTTFIRYKGPTGSLFTSFPIQIFGSILLIGNISWTLTTFFRKIFFPFHDNLYLLYCSVSFFWKKERKIDCKNKLRNCLTFWCFPRTISTNKWVSAVRL